MVRVRKMNGTDVEAVSAIRVRGWQSAYAGILPRSYLEAMTVEDDAARRREWFSLPHRQSVDLVAVDGGEPVGWINYGPSRSEVPEVPDVRTGEINALYVRPGLTGRGIGRGLLDEAHALMQSQEFRAVLLWVLADNQGARRFYERAGYRADGHTQADVYDGVAVPELRYRRACWSGPRTGVADSTVGHTDASGSAR
ncbi:N-acetyltransferase [Streptomyces xanthochromogenes]|uniref:GNAT family N-acetyltransferase n=1 Tax=Streptomyces xanthochromogenes TaxID=67384 RepID=UPI001677C991|nr:GNAT family N-acetyltransferase [Streptomyces xanthochromogenes]GHB36666.1 N-acetyltransferase [Streptomyces xanthochromogenes]